MVSSYDNNFDLQAEKVREVLHAEPIAAQLPRGQLPKQALVLHRQPALPFLSIYFAIIRSSADYRSSRLGHVFTMPHDVPMIKLNNLSKASDVLKRGTSKDSRPVSIVF